MGKDIAKKIKPAIKRDLEISRARRRRDWKRQIKLSIDPERARELRRSSMPHLRDVCTMCGKYCSIKLTEKYCSL